MNQIFNSLENIPLQVSLQKEQLRNVFQKSFLCWLLCRFRWFYKGFAKELALNISDLLQIPLARSLAEIRITASGANGFSLQTSLQVQVVLQRLCKGIRIEYQWFTANIVCRFVCRNLKLYRTFEIITMNNFDHIIEVSDKNN
jgi:hypothetical protein